MRETLPQALTGRVKFYDVERPETVLYQRKNVICNSVAYLFARLMASSTDPVAGVWGLAIGAGGVASAGWSEDQQPDPEATQTALLSEITRKPLAQAQFLDPNNNPTTGLTTTVSFTTILNATSDAISTPIREMGLIGGGTTDASAGGPTNMLNTPYFDPLNPTKNSVILINYLTTPSFILPADINIAIEWWLSFA